MEFVLETTMEIALNAMYSQAIWFGRRQKTERYIYNIRAHLTLQGEDGTSKNKPNEEATNSTNM